MTWNPQQSLGKHFRPITPSKYRLIQLQWERIVGFLILCRRIFWELLLIMLDKCLLFRFFWKYSVINVLIIVWNYVRSFVIQNFLKAEVNNLTDLHLYIFPHHLHFKKLHFRCTFASIISAGYQTNLIYICSIRFMTLTLFALEQFMHLRCRTVILENIISKAKTAQSHCIKSTCLLKYHLKS